MSRSADIAVVGGGLVGSCLAYGLVRRGADVVLYDPDEDDLHASAGNFGLVWVQGKGLGAPAYETLTRRSVAAWTGFADELRAAVGIDPAYRQCGGIKMALSEAELERQRDTLHRMHNQAGAQDTRMLDAGEVRAMVPAAGPMVVGGVWCPRDGHADPLFTHTALRKALAQSPRVTIRRQRVGRIVPQAGAFALTDAAQTLTVGRVAIAAGLGSQVLAEGLGLRAPLRPQRGQILVAERQAPFLDVACHTVRQTSSGTVLIGDSKEDVGFDRGTTAAVGAQMAARAAQMFPRLAGARIIRQWGALRVMSPDGLPIYAQSERYEGAMLLTCHSGVTLAAAHAGEVADAVLDGTLGERYAAFSPERFAAAA